MVLSIPLPADLAGGKQNGRVMTSNLFASLIVGSVVLSEAFHHLNLRSGPIKQRRNSDKFAVLQQTLTAGSFDMTLVVAELYNFTHRRLL